MKVVLLVLLFPILNPAAASFTRTMFKSVQQVPLERRLATSARLPPVKFLRPTPVLRKQKPQPQIRKAQQTSSDIVGVANLRTVNIQTQDTLDHIVQSSIKNSKDNQPQIIIINQPVPIGTEGDLRPLSTYDLDKGNYITGPYPPLNYNLTGPMTAYEIDGLIIHLNKISDLYTSFYDMLPSEQPTLKGGDQSLNLFEFYGKVRAFVNGFMSVRVKLQKDIDFAVNRLITLRTGQDPMLKYFGFFSSFTLLRKKTIVYESRDPMFATYANMCRVNVDLYNQNVNSVLAKTYSLQRLSRFFDNEIMQLKNRSTNNNMLFVVDKFNDVLMFVVHILEIRNELLTNISGLQKDLLYAKGLRRSFEGILTQIDQRVTADMSQDKVSYAVNKTQAKLSASKFKIGLTVALLVSVWFN